MSEDTIKDCGNSGEPSQKRMRLSPDELPQEIKILENTEIKTGFVKIDYVTIYIDGQKIDLLNIDSEIPSKICPSDSFLEEAEKENSPTLKQRSAIEKKLENVNNHLSNYLGQMITSEILGNNYQAIPDQLVICQENEFRLPRENTHENGPSHFLIVICPTECDGGEINFPEMKKKLVGKTGKVLSYALFKSKTLYEVMKVTKGLRVLVTYKIFAKPLKVKKEDLFIIDAEKLLGLLKDIQDTNVLIPVTDGNVAQKVCDNAKINYKLVFAPRKHPTTVHSDISTIEEATECRYFDAIEFHDMLYDKAVEFSVSRQIDLSKPKLITDKYKRCVKDHPQGYERETLSYYSFLLINPDEKYRSENKDK